MLSSSNNKILRDYGPKFDNSEIFHTSAYATAQNGGGIGVAGASTSLDVAKRQAMEEQRKYIRGYQNSKITSSAYRLQRVASVPPRTAGGVGAVSGSRPGGSARGPLGPSPSATPPARAARPISLGH